jgi:hypothetical protein
MYEVFKMKYKYILFNILLLTAFFNIACGQNSKIIKSNSDWYEAGSKPESYVIGKDDAVKFDGEAAYYLRSIKDVSDGFGTIMTDIKPDRFMNKRVRLSGFIKTENVDNWAGMWMRIDGPTSGEMLGFDNMKNRPIEGTNDWQKYEIVLDVPDNSTGVFYGVLIHGNGQAWLGDFSFEIVGDDVKTTNMLKR